MLETLTTSEGRVEIAVDPDGVNTVEVFPNDVSQFISVRSCRTTYSSGLIAKILAVQGIAWVCDEISRDEDPNHASKYLLNDLAAYFSPADLAGKRILDFGCGAGASTAILARTFPQAQFTGVELRAELLEIAKGRASHYGLTNTSFIVSPHGSSVPPNLDEYDLVILSAVVEHLLPDERSVILPLLWKRVRSGGCLFLDQTPYRYFPLELHTTMLPFINYLPDSLAFAYAKAFSKRIDPRETWESLLRRGIRGATEREIGSALAGSRLLKCKRGDRIDLWYDNTNPQRFATVKSVAKHILKLLYRSTGVCMIPDLALAFQKQ